MWEDDDQCSKDSLKSDDELVLTNMNADMRSIFDPIVNQFLLLISELLVPDVKAILVVGGFSETPYMMRRIRESFNGRVATISSPPCPGSADCSGAVTMRIHPDSVVSRISKKTYGIMKAIPSISGVHPVSSRFESISGRVYCEDGFSIFVRKGDEVRWNDYVTKGFFPMSEFQTKFIVDLYSTIEDVRYVTDKGMQWEGAFAMQFPNQLELGFEPDVEVSMHALWPQQDTSGRHGAQLRQSEARDASRPV